MTEVLIQHQEFVNHETCKNCGALFTFDNPAVFYPLGQYNLCKDCDQDNLERASKQLHRRKMLEMLSYQE